MNTAIIDEGRSFLGRILLEVYDTDGLRRISAMLSATNASSFAGHPAGTLILARLEYDFGEIRIYFERNDSRPWNLYPSTDGPFELTFNGRPLIEPADFGAIDGYRGTLDLVPLLDDNGLAVTWKRSVAIPW